ncbi:MAG: sugar ABC transporter substrate-binding protein [Spirochaetales bacterium]|nr:sugar ABC transporter substrate-binding protein [Spirochaetales bacterium]
MKKYLFICILILTQGLLFAAGQQGMEVTPVDIEKDASKMGDVTIKTFISADQKWNEIVNVMVQEFESLYPNLKIQEEAISGSFDSKLIVMHASGTAPDIHTMTPSNILPYVRSGALMPLDGYLAASDVLGNDDLWPVNHKAYRYDGETFGEGELYALIKDWTPDFMMFYNKSLFNRAGVAYPDAKKPMNWDQYRDMLSKLSVKNSAGEFTQYAATFDFVPIQQLYQMILTNGGRVFNEDGTKATLSEPKTREAIEYWVSLMNGPNAVVPFYEAPVPMTSGDLFKAGKSGITFFGRWAIPQMFADADLDFGLAPPPVPAGGKRVSTIAGGLSWVMSSTTKHPDATWKFLEFLMTEGQANLAEIGFNIPGNKTVAEEMYKRESDPQMIEWNNFFLEEAEKYTVPFPMSGYVSSSFVETTIQDQLREHFYNNVSLDVAIKQAETIINAEIADWVE